MHTLKISSKPSTITISGSNNLLAVSYNSDSISAFPPNLSVYNIGPSFILKEQTVDGPCFSLGRSIAPFQSGFFASAPASSFRWGDPGSLILKLLPPFEEFQKLPYPNIPYGETLSSSKSGNLVIACTPLSSSDCLLIEGRKIRALNAPVSTNLFGLSVAVSPNSSHICTISSSVEGNSLLHFFNNQGNLIATFTLPHNPPLTARSYPPFIQFLDEKHVIVSFFDVSKILLYKNTNNGWVLVQTHDTDAKSMSLIGKNIVSLSRDGKVQILNKDFDVLNQEIVPKTFQKSAFTKVTGGSDWFAVLEESPEKRRIHIYTMRMNPFVKGTGIFILFLVIVAVYIFLRTKLDFSRFINRLERRRNAKQI
ncbi:hypothetical protein GPJ56_001932 [Histomonas meleagridis]|uniref:uncharacterized protein n=1 Tax=Histomonas meleagridis TaxID=135588 RepID=UPI0035597559|nr:hypothetical protein GPJ56_001932 [Histomonas meleagridis]KAH0800992.1 hypothetical protein GO595_006308 [Histomonas meleagridis]